MKPLSGRVANMPRSGIRVVMELADSLEDVIQLGVGEPDLGTPAPVIEGAFEAARNGFTRYTPTAGYESLRRAVANRIGVDHQRACEIDEVIVTPGAVSALTAAVLALVDTGDEVLIPDPGWPNYRAICLLAHAEPVAYPLDRERAYAPDIEALARLVGPRTKAIIVNSPNNPTGAVYSETVTRDLMAFARSNDLYVISDEIYEALVFDGDHVPMARFDPDRRVITILGCSKTYAMTGWRIGFAVADPEVVAQMTKVQQSTLSCASSVSQKAAEAALAIDRRWIDGIRSAYRSRRDLVVSILGQHLSTIPRGAFYALIDASIAGLDSYAIAKDLLVNQRVATAPGDTFGSSCSGMLRVSFAASPGDLREGCGRIAAYLAARGGGA